jgi:hypothetical protein
MYNVNIDTDNITQSETSNKEIIMSNKQLRIALRYIHLVVSIFIGLYIYMPILAENDLYRFFVQFVVISFVALSGVAMWQFSVISQWRRNRKAGEA